MTTGKHSLPDRTGQLHMWTQSIVTACTTLHKPTRANPSMENTVGNEVPHLAMERPGGNNY